MAMTWNQFKEHIDAVLKNESISGDTEIWVIDVTFPRSDRFGMNGELLDEPCVSVTPALGINITS